MLRITLHSSKQYCIISLELYSHWFWLEWTSTHRIPLAPLHCMWALNTPAVNILWYLYMSHGTLSNSCFGTSQMAAYNGDSNILSMLLENGANPNIQVKNYSICMSQLYYIYYFVQDANGLSASHMAAVEGHTHCIIALASHKAYLNCTDFSDERCSFL